LLERFRFAQVGPDLLRIEPRLNRGLGRCDASAHCGVGERHPRRLQLLAFHGPKARPIVFTRAREDEVELESYRGLVEGNAL
jgi:hypothetical protein